jgi:hypothetical protein
VERCEAEAIYDQGREAVVAVLLRMDEQIQRLEQRVARQDERIAQLERRLNRDSRNSSAPPSSDPPSTGRSAARMPLGANVVARLVTRAMAVSCCHYGGVLPQPSVPARIARSEGCRESSALMRATLRSPMRS